MEFSFALNLLFQILKVVAPFLAKKMYRESEIKKHIEIDVRSTQPITASIRRDIPEITIYFRFTNKSPYLDLKFEGGTFELWFRSNRGMQPIGRFSLISREIIKKGETKEIFWQSQLNYFQTNYLTKLHNDKEVTASISQLVLWFSSSLYPYLNIMLDLKNKPCKIE